MEYAAPILFALGTWWLSTVLMMWRSQRASPGCRGTMAFMTILALAGCFATAWTREWTGASGAYLGFLAGIAVWAWHEMSYFLGVVTGPRPRACPPDVSKARRFSLGIQASLWHELAIVATAALLVGLTWGAANLTAPLTFTVLWLMRWSAKLNIFLGVRNLHQEFWPDHLRYLGSYVHTARMNALFPVSMALAWLLRQLLLLPPPSISLFRHFQLTSSSSSSSSSFSFTDSRFFHLLADEVLM